MKTTKLLICAVAAIAAYSAANAQGQNIPATLSTITPGLSVNGTYDGGGFVHDLPSGVLDFTSFDSFCVAPLEILGYGDTVIYQVQDLSSLANSEDIARLIGGYLASPQTDLDAAAVQWAIWEVTSETSLTRSLLGGDVRVTTPVSEDTALLANVYLSNLSTYSPVSLTYLTSDTHQDIVTWNLVPEPGTAALAALSGLALLRRRRR